MPSRRRNVPSLLLLLIAAFANTAYSQQPRKQQPLQPIGDVLHLFLDKDKNQKVTMSEVDSQISMLEVLFQSTAEGDEQGEQYRKILKAVKAAAPTIFVLLDSNSDKGLTKSELNYVTKFETSLKKGGGMREFLRDVFSLLDTNGDDQLSADELFAASQSSKTISDVTVRFHALFPLRGNPSELEEFVKETIESFGGSDSLDKASVEKSMKWIDDDGDGYINRKEVGKYYNFAGKQFLDTSKSIRQMGPMLAMFGGVDVNSGGGGGGGFKMDF
ncbi:hypothetical protein HJC23_002254 [Cyclotella cryptica]|uniref:EF-hand domain-containing protein n=1 Tax=Cyclotella cryptica TaxID=29204 RepID=A0ABD3QH29_9STRA|eukprot:CCRYP_005694-RA/>CCRYP_005694-RA protein AED:0.37 eAED:0.36 QI:0/-1/0/1/-1/1/1/0/272